MLAGFYGWQKMGCVFLTVMRWGERGGYLWWATGQAGKCGLSKPLLPLPSGCPPRMGVVRAARGAQLVDGWGEGKLALAGGISPLPKGEG